MGAKQPLSLIQHLHCQLFINSMLGTYGHFWYTLEHTKCRNMHEQLDDAVRGGPAAGTTSIVKSGW
eukprot:scaffold88485_cov18-Tisochrysis_lutea.AAC.3